MGSTKVWGMIGALNVRFLNFERSLDLGRCELIELGALLDETRKAFKLNSAIFAALRPKWTPPPSSVSLEATKPGANYSVTSVAVVVLAIGLTHFIVKVGGLMEEKGYAELVLARRWWAAFIS